MCNGPAVRSPACFHPGGAKMPIHRVDLTGHSLTADEETPGNDWILVTVPCQRTTSRKHITSDHGAERGIERRTARKLVAPGFRVGCRRGPTFGVRLAKSVIRSARFTAPVLFVLRALNKWSRGRGLRRPMHLFCEASLFGEDRCTGVTATTVSFSRTLRHTREPRRGTWPRLRAPGGAKSWPPHSRRPAGRHR